MQPGILAQIGMSRRIVRTPLFGLLRILEKYVSKIALGQQPGRSGCRRCEIACHIIADRPRKSARLKAPAGECLWESWRGGALRVRVIDLKPQLPVIGVDGDGP